MFAFISGISPLGMLVILVVALLVFGNRLPEVARSMGRAMNEFKKGFRDVEDEIKNDPQEPQKLDSPRSEAADPQVHDQAKEHQH